MTIQETTDVGSQSLQITVPQQMITSCTGSIVTSLLMTPFDVVKIRLQAEQPKRNSILGTVMRLTRHEGPLSLWSGMSLTLASAVPCTIIYFVTYEHLKLYINSFHEGENDPYWVPPMAGASARAWAVTVVSPLELIKTKMQSKKFNYIDDFNNWKLNLDVEEHVCRFLPTAVDNGKATKRKQIINNCYLEIAWAVRSLLENHGFQGLFKGLSSTLFRDVPFSGLYWFNYELVKSVLPLEMPVFGSSFISGLIAGSVAGTVTAPFDVIKTNQQIEWEERRVLAGTPQCRSSMAQIVQHIYRTAGLRGLFAGLTPRLLKVAPSCAIMISSYECGKHIFYKYNQQKDQR